MNTNTVKFTDIDKALATQAERIAALEAENARLRMALRHFANLGNWIATPNTGLDYEGYDSFEWTWDGQGELEVPIAIAQDALGEYPVDDEDEDSRKPRSRRPSCQPESLERPMARVAELEAENATLAMQNAAFRALYGNLDHDAMEAEHQQQAERIAALEAENARLREAVNWDVVNALAELTELEDALRRIVQLENDSDTSDLVVLRKALRIAVDALGKKEER